MIYLKEVIDTCKAEAISSRMLVDEQAEWRFFCRYYSNKFHTPLHLVLEMAPEFVIKQVMEHQLEDVNVVEKMTELLNMIYTIEDPNYEAANEEDLQDFISKAVEEEEERVKSGKPVHVSKNEKRDEASIQQVLKKDVEPQKELPKEGFVNLGYFAKQNKEE